MTPSVARATIAHLILGPRDVNPGSGTVQLHAHQQDAVGLLRNRLDESRGALLADDVGLGKTFTALALARGVRTLALVPAALRDTWRDAARRADVSIEIASLEMLSRGHAPAGTFDLVIVDEAHHLRNPATLRFIAARELCRDARVLLLTATPVQNSEADLRTLLSLFLGERARAAPVAALAQHVVRRTAGMLAPVAPLPDVAEPQWLPPFDDADCLDRILALPPPVPPLGGGDPGALGAYSLARQWSSSRAALDAALRRRLARGLALADSLRAGVLPTRAELGAWVHADGAQQLAFPELIAATGSASCAELLVHVEAHLAGVRDLLGWMRVTPDSDEARAARLRDVLGRHPGAQVVAFSEFAETVTALYGRLARTTRAAMLTHTGGRVAGGPLSRREIVARLTPGVAAPDAERIHLLLATDVLSEGVGLHAASVVVHLDLAWNPARLEQRVGRLRRLGARTDRVHVYCMPAPAPAERMLRVEARLRTKLERADRAIGVAGTILPSAIESRPSATARTNRFALLLEGWRQGGIADEPVAAAVRGTRAGALICARDGERLRLLAWDGTRIIDDDEDVEPWLGMVAGAEAPCSDESLALVRDAVSAWLARRATSAVVDLTALRVARSRRTVLHRADGISRRAPRHARAQVAGLVRAARAAATATLSAGAERVLDELARAAMPDDAWLRAVGQFAALHARDRRLPARIEVVLLVVPC